MPIFARSLFQLADLRSAATRRLPLALAAVLALSLSAAIVPAGAFVTKVGMPVTVGLQPRDTTTFFDGSRAKVGTFDNHEGNPVLQSTNTYAIYWDPRDHYHGDWQHLIDNFFQAFGAVSGSLGTVFAVDSQYTDKANVHASYNSTFRGAYTDTEPYPVVAGCKDPATLEPSYADAITCVTDAQIRTQLKEFIGAHGLQKGMGSIFYLLTPPGVTVCVDEGESASHCSDKPSSASSFCSYHSAITPTHPTEGDANTILYAVIPWTAGGLGDYHLPSADETPAFDCQDGGFSFNSKTGLVEKEHEKALNLAEEEAFTKMSTEEQAIVEHERRLEKPHQEEPNQISGNGPDGTPDTGLADLIIGQIGVEQQNVVTDPLLNAWQDEDGNEATDECRNFFSPPLGGELKANPLTEAGSLYTQTLSGGNYYLNDAFDLAAVIYPYPGVPCLGGISIEPQFTAPNPVNTGDIVGFDGMESNFTLNAGVKFSSLGAEEPAYATYKWNFGDGSPEVTGFAPGAPSVNSPGTSPCAAPWEAPCAASTFHSYQYGGTYDVTLTVTDVGGNTASVTNPIAVVGPPPPTSTVQSSENAGQTTASGGSSFTGATGTSAPAPAPVPNPVAAEAVVSRSLRSARRKGLVVRYSVNEQVAGHFEVLLNRAVARRLGIGGAAAADLPAGYPPELVVARAILITTKGGRSTVDIQFSKRTAARLGRLSKVSLMLRLIVRNAASSDPATTTVLSTVTLSG